VEIQTDILCDLKTRQDDLAGIGAFPCGSNEAKTIEVDASHVSLISKPKEIADLILLAAGNSA
jgi:hypothetical protein